MAEATRYRVLGAGGLQQVRFCLKRANAQDQKIGGQGRDTRANVRGHINIHGWAASEVLEPKLAEAGIVQRVSQAHLL